ncbi:HAD hydrolase-like protein [Streptosporangium soli]|nr:HAD hydrolase-like protein [Streptosporangium sp. KLBMP 9127]
MGVGWLVGDNLVADIAGGNAAGLRTIWVDRGTWPVRSTPRSMLSLMCLRP